MTGRYPWRFGSAAPGGAWGFVGARFATDTFTLGKMLQRTGYRTGYVGKWHLGTEMTTKDGKVQNETNVDYTKPLKIGPPQYGFDESFILPGSLDMYPYAYARNNVWQGEVTAQKGWSAFHRVGPAEKDFQDHEVLETFYGEAESFIAKQNKENPFFLYLALTAPHTPTSPGVKWQGKSKLGVYGDFVMEVDHAVERVLDGLKEKGVYENTLVLFSSDHGPASYAGNILKATPGQIHLLEKKGHYPSGPHRGYKFSIYEGGLRVPLIAHWPSVIEPGGRCDALVGLCDLMATFAELSNSKLNPENAPDSISFAKLLRHPNSPGARQNLVMQSALGCFAVRDGEWKLCLCPGSGAKGIYGNKPTQENAWRSASQDFKGDVKEADLTQSPFVQLFNLDKDPHEDRNLAAEYPQRVTEMLALLRQQVENGRSTQGPKLANDRHVNIVGNRVPDFVRKQLQSK
jgi:arylsulfatase A-like enzyme